MLNPLNFISKFIKSSNQKELGKLSKILDKVNSYEEKIKKLDDADFPQKTENFKKQIDQGININDLLPEAFALVREASKRVRGTMSR